MIIPSNLSQLPSQLSSLVAFTPMLNVHPMQTRDKSYIIKSKVYIVYTNMPWEPRYWQEVMQFPEWKASMRVEDDALLRKNTLDLVPKPKHQKVISFHCFTKQKTLASGAIDKRKNRLITQGFLQTFELDNIEIFSPVVKTTTIRLVLSIAVHYGWDIR